MINAEEKEKIIHQISQAVLRFDDQQCINLCRLVIAEKMDPLRAVNEGLARGMVEVGKYYQTGKYFVPELLLCSDALYAGLEILQPHLNKTVRPGGTGKLIIGVVEGDIHDIGKNLVKAMFVASGWEVHDLGRDVPCEKFIASNQEIRADIVGLSTLMTTSMMAMPEVINKLHTMDSSVKVIVGGAPLSLELAKKYGADGYASDAMAAVLEAERLISL